MTEPPPSSATASDSASGARDEASGSLGRSAAVSVLWTGVEKWTGRVTGIITLAVLARQLTAAEFGVAAAALAIVPLVRALSEFCFSSYVIQLKKTDQETLSTALWVTLGTGALVGGALFAAAPAIAAIMSLPDLVPVLRAMLLALFVTLSATVPIGLLRRRMRFRVLAVQGLVAQVLAQVVAVAMALLGAGVWALVAQFIIAESVFALAVWVSASWLPSRAWSSLRAREALRFGLSAFGGHVGETAAYWAQSAIISSTLGAAALGYVAVAERLVLAVRDSAGLAVAPVSQVVFAQVQLSPGRLIDAYRRATSFSLAAVVPAMAILALVAPVVIPIVYGDGWDTSIPLTQALALAAAFVFLRTLDRGLMYGLGMPGRWLAYAWAADALVLLMTWGAVQFDVVAYGWGFLFVSMVVTIVRAFVISRILRERIRALYCPSARIVLPAGGATAISAAVTNWLGGVPDFAQLTATVFVFFGAYAILLRVAAADLMRNLLEVLPMPATGRSTIRSLLRI